MRSRGWVGGVGLRESVTAEGQDQAMAGLFEVQDFLRPGKTHRGAGSCEL